MEKRSKTHVDELNSNNPSDSTPTPLNPFITSFTQEYVVLDYYKKGCFYEKQAKLIIRYEANKHTYVVNQKRIGFFPKVQTNIFDTIEQAIRFYNKVTR